MDDRNAQFGKLVVIAGILGRLLGFQIHQHNVGDQQTHHRLGLGYARAVDGWPLRDDAETVILPVTGRVQTSDGEGVRHLALAGVGLARLTAFTVRDDIAAGRLVPVLGHLDAGGKEAFHAVHVGQGGPLPSRVRALLDFLAGHGRVA